MSDEQVYEALAEHLDRLPVGFPRTPQGVEMRILKRFFTPEEAALAVQLTLQPETPEQFAARTGRDAGDMTRKLDEMSRKGLIFRVRRGPHVLYMAAMFLVGIWEFHINDLDPDLIRDVHEYLPFFFDPINDLTQQVRTIPIPKSITPEQAVMPYEDARQIISKQEKIVVAPCVCRKEHGVAGHRCDKPLETCLVFGDFAQYYEDNGFGRSIDVDEALKILEVASKNSMVLQPPNCQDTYAICSCCGCCCQMLKNLKRLPEPAKYVASNYFATVDKELCTGCETCVERCQMDAVIMDGESALILKERCIGCGLCVPTCSDEAIILHAKPEEERYTPPSDFNDTYFRIATERMARLKEMEANGPHS